MGVEVEANNQGGGGGDEHNEEQEALQVVFVNLYRPVPGYEQILPKEHADQLAQVVDELVDRKVEAKFALFLIVGGGQRSIGNTAN